jgi:hypothetical protein
MSDVPSGRADALFGRNSSRDIALRFDRPMPAVLQQLHALEFDYDEGYDFEPFPGFLSEQDTREWIRAWTGDDALDGGEYLVFGSDGMGGNAAIWLVHPDRTVLEQPIVFFESEGELGVVASDFRDFLWLLAGGMGPSEAILYPECEDLAPNARFTAFAQHHAGPSRGGPKEILERARGAYPDFARRVLAGVRED